MGWGRLQDPELVAQLTRGGGTFNPTPNLGWGLET